MAPLVFRHVATDLNTYGYFTALDHPALNGNPGAKLIASGYAGLEWSYEHLAYNPHPVGVSYLGQPGTGRWVIYNEDFADIPLYAGFAFSIDNGSAGAAFFIHEATSLNTSGFATRLGRPETFGHPQRLLQVCHFIDTPGASRGIVAVRNPHPIGVWFNPIPFASDWMIFNTDMSPIPIGSKFMVEVAWEANPDWDEHFHPCRTGPTTIRSRSPDRAYFDLTGSGIYFGTTAMLVTVNLSIALSGISVSGDPPSPILSFNPHSVTTGGDLDVTVVHPVGAMPILPLLAIINADGAPMPPGVGFNVRE